MDFERIYRMYFKDVFLYLRVLSADTDTAEEITQETFVKALRSIDTFDGSKDSMAVYDRQKYILHILQEADQICR